MPRKGESTDTLDRQQKLSVDDFRDLGDANKLLAGKDKKPAEVAATAALGAPPVPALAQVLATPEPPKIANSKLVTIAVTEDVPLRDVLFELGRLAKVDIEIGPGLDGAGINLRATDRPFNEVIERIAKLGNLRYSVVGNAIRVERDTPFIKNYSLDFLNIIRSSTSTYSLSTNVLSAGTSGGSGSGSGSGSSGGGGGSSSSGASGSSGSSSSGGFGSTGSTTNINSQGESDLFSSLEASLTEILNYNPNPLEPTADAAAATTPATTPGGLGAPAQAASASTASTRFVINRQSNVLTVNGTQAQHDMIERFLKLLSRNSSAQVLIEAKVVEVSLSDQFLSGVNWNSIIGNNRNFISGGRFIPQSIDSLAIPNSTQLSTPTSFDGAFTAGINRGDLDAVIALTQRFGTTRTLSSPRLAAINNQQAVLTFARNEIFFNCTAQQGAIVPNQGSPGTNQNQPTVSCTSQTVPIGIIMSILPSINLETQEVTLNVRPTLTRQVRTVQNPGNILAARVVNTPSDVTINADVPVIEVRELDSVMKVKSGGVMVIGGLMEDISRNTDTGVPGAQEIPLLGNLFKSRNEDSTKRELIIFIKATIINTDGSAQQIDKAVYQKFTTDPRPLFPSQDSQ